MKIIHALKNCQPLNYHDTIDSLELSSGKRKLHIFRKTVKTCHVLQEILAHFTQNKLL